MEKDNDTECELAAWELLAKSRSEVERWKKAIIPFLAVHAGQYGKDHYGDGCMHYTHYDLLKEAGGRMDDFKRCGDNSPANVPVVAPPTLDSGLPDDAPGG